ncbi:MAG TPA: LiaF domain-containing protein [Chitinophagales bacterium]|nr:LiaF domain-containing protein [Chitinophagales bacterium]
MEKYPSQRSNGNIWLGALVLIIGVGFFLCKMNLPFSDLLFNWQTLLITIGIFIGLRSGFKGASWLILILIGGIFLLQDVVPWLHWHQYGWPVALILLGLFLIFRPRRNWHRDNEWNWKNYGEASEAKFSNEEFINHTAVFGSVEKTILSKDFHGGNLTSFFGGTELNLIQADINGKVILDITTIFGGTKLIVPSNWEIKSELVAVFGGIEDKRPVQSTVNPEKVLILKGTTIFGGIEIVSY